MPGGGPSHGTLTMEDDGSYVYTPLPTYTGTDSFTYTISDDHASSTATVSITVNRRTGGGNNDPRPDDPGGPTREPDGPPRDGPVQL